MLLTDAIAEYKKDTTKRIIREGNNRGIIDVWFTVENEKLMLNEYVLEASGHRFRKVVAPFQTSPHDDWILI